MSPRKIRVVHVLHSFATGGLEKGVATIIRYASEPFEHIVVCLSKSGKTERLLPPGTKVYELHKPTGNSLFFLLKLARVLKSLKPAIIHTRNWGGMDAIIAARVAGFKSVVQGEHGWEIDDPEGHNSRRLKIRRFLCRWVQEYTCVSKHIELWLLGEVKLRKPITQIYNGVDTQVFCPRDGASRIRTELGISEKSFVAGVIGRLDPIKDHPTVFRAFGEAKKLRPDAHLLVVGDGPERDHLERIAGNGTLFLGNRSDIHEVFQSVDVFILASLNEGTSNTILEAMATGIPVIATKVGGNPELVEDGVTGTLVPPKDSRAMTAALLKYLNNKGLRDAEGRDGRRRAHHAFSIDTMVKSYEAVYRRVAFSEQYTFSIKAAGIR